MQEELLSNRALIFIAGQVYWKCKRRYIDERISHSGKHSRRTAIGSLYFSIFGHETAKFHEFATILEYYMSKELSFEDDVLRAAQGLLRKFSMLSGVHCFEGLSSPLGQSMSFQAYGMPLSRAFGRRRAFPSYSWAGWKSTPFYSDLIIDGTRNSFVLWFCKLNDGQIYRINEHGRLRKAQPPKFEDAIKNAMRELEAVPVAGIPVPISDIDVGAVRVDSYPLLVFWTLVVNLRISPRQFPQFRGLNYIWQSDSRSKTNFPIGHIHYEPVDRNGNTVHAEVAMDDILPASEGQVEKFAIISASSTAFFALLLRWNNGIAERLGAVTLEKTILESCLEPGPRWKLIVLG